ncbi:hypothetical protein [Saccharopolyspora hattusasensis]|uniref:hypothetical protein n=1 Tax=Saccharopolyspora hattusasensis TaxID=1128679 RepID=UPI003D969BD0
MSDNEIVPLPPNGPDSGPQTGEDEQYFSCRPSLTIRRYSAQSHLTLLLRQAEHAIRDVCDNLIHNRCKDTELYDLAHGLEIVAGGVKGYLDTKDPAGGAK